MKTLIYFTLISVLSIILLLLLDIQLLHAATKQTELQIRANVVCNCLVNGILINIQNQPCISTCNSLQSMNKTPGIDIQYRDGYKEVNY